MGDESTNLEHYERLVASHPDVVMKGAKSRYTSVNGHMFSFLTQEGRVALRLSADDRARFKALLGEEPCVQYGAVMRDYVTVPDELLPNLRTMKTYFAASYAYVSSLKPKPTTRKKKTGSKKTGSNKTGSKKASSKETASKRKLAAKKTKKKAAMKK